MRKRIGVRDLILGMYVDELCGSWMDHPFWKKSFKLEDQNDLVSLKQSNIQEVWIDTAKGLDVPLHIASAVSDSDVAKQTEEVLLAAQTKSEQVVVAKLTLDQELDRARKIKEQGKQAIVAMFAEVRMGKALPMDEMENLVDEINQSVARNNTALLSLVRLKTKDDYTYLHSVAVCALMIALGKNLGIEGNELKSLGMAGLLHDVGKVAIPDVVLNKPGKLSESKFELVKSHPLRGWEILQQCPAADEVARDVCRHHHERVDGAGYPDKLSGDALSLAARMGAVCDVYDAITSDRCYKAGWAPADAIRKMAEWQKGHFDETIFQAFVRTIGIYPVGTLLKLKSGRLGVVADQSKKSLLKPIVKVFFSTRSNAGIPMELIDMSHTQDSIENIEDVAKWGFDLEKMTGIC
ncbi:HD-GYP domain-containing protein [Sulfuriferula nivalis]|uniref:Cyclic di-GMP phosphodiesterase n=1 Tax=Sulfuriferula nivalis TaxID=2675298 RepID=A0A809S9Y6_9PROT|nr:HD-GYP domain-containing protein [Sulfuriferula nivalis]BBP01232.1 cyclic di-GMP phosphodiesterase [Sulfuriferula nivalis]